MQHQDNHQGRSGGDQGTVQGLRQRHVKDSVRAYRGESYGSFHEYGQIPRYCRSAVAITGHQREPQWSGRSLYAVATKHRSGDHRRAPARDNNPAAATSKRNPT